MPHTHSYSEQRSSVCASGSVGHRACTHASMHALCAQAVKVNSLGKWKTALQMVSMSTLLVLRQDHSDLAAWLLVSCESG